MRACIYKPSKSAMSSGVAKSRHWVLEFPRNAARSIDPLMGWTSSGDTQSQVRMRFESKEAAMAYAERHGIDAAVAEPRTRKPNIRPGGYGDNFATGRRETWTH